MQRRMTAGYARDVPAVLAIDQGTSSTRALVVAEDGSVLAEASAPVRPRAHGEGAVEQDPAELLASVVDAGRNALAAAGTEVAAVGLGNQGETVLMWDPVSLRPLGPAVSWQDRRAADVTERLAPRAERLREITGLPLDPYFAAPKMAWLRERADADGAAVGTIDAWVTESLCGERVTDAATASRTLLLDLDSTEWSREACEAFGVTPELLPRIVDCDATVGETDAFGPRLPVAGLAVDQQAALLAQSCLAPGEAKCTYGTGAFILAAAGERPLRSSAGLAACVAWRLGGRASYCLDGQVYTAGAAVGWLERLGLIRGPEEIDALAGEAPAPGGPLFVPALAGLGAPLWEPRARGAWLGLSLASGRGELVGAVAWGIAAQIASLAQAVAGDLGRPLERLRVDGGLTRSRALMQAQADLLQARVELFPSPEATALGVAALARLACGQASGPADAVPPWRAAATFEPRMDAARAREHLASFESAAGMLAQAARDA